MGIARTSGYESTVNLSKSGSVFRIDVDDLEGWSWRMSQDPSKPLSEFDGGLMRHNIFQAFRFELEEMKSSHFNSSFAVFDEKIYLAFNFSQEFDNKELRLTLRDTVLAHRFLTSVGIENNYDEHGEEIRKTSELILAQ